MSVALCPVCAAVCEPGKRRCRKHGRKKDKRPSAAARGYDSRHRRDRDRYLRQHPTCEDCREQPATVLDHTDGLGPLGPYGHDPDNFRALCASCHGTKTARQTPGGWNTGGPGWPD